MKNKISNTKETDYHPKTLSEFLVHICIVILMVSFIGLIWVFLQNKIIQYFGENVYLLIVFGIFLAYILISIVKKIIKKIHSKNTKVLK
jgi:hypothetical protein